MPTCLEPPLFSLTCRVCGVPCSPFTLPSESGLRLCMLCAAALCTAHLDTVLGALPGYAVPIARPGWSVRLCEAINQIASQQARFCHRWRDVQVLRLRHMFVSTMTVQSLSTVFVGGSLVPGLHGSGQC